MVNCVYIIWKLIREALKICIIQVLNSGLILKTLTYVFWVLKISSQRDGSFEYPQQIFRLKTKKNYFLITYSYLEAWTLFNSGFEVYAATHGQRSCPWSSATVEWYPTFCICVANSLVGDKQRAWVSLTCVSRHCRIEMEKVAVLPVPDWALEW